MNWQEIAKIDDMQQRWIEASKKVTRRETVLAGDDIISRTSREQALERHGVFQSTAMMGSWIHDEVLACSRVLRELRPVKDLAVSLGTAFAHLLDLSRQTPGQAQMALEMRGYELCTCGSGAVHYVPRGQGHSHDA